MRRLQSQNLYPNCLSMELEAIPVNTEQFDLYLNINFNEQWESLLDGRVKFGLRGGQLEFKPNNLEIPSKIGLKNSLERTKIGTAKIITKPYSLEATFTVSPPDIYITETEGLWRHDLSPNKYGILERKLVFFLLETKLQSYLSTIQLGSEETQPEQNLVEIEDEKITDTLLSLQEVIQRICQAPTNDFLTLAKLAALNPKQDLAGGNFRGTELNGVELNGANLYGANLRGADLTDADLSEADLSHAKLNGADLSGAYLENANLTNADLHRASLALANLIGADLSGANLKETNLSNTNLTAANVSKTQFGNNPGISEQMKLNLQSKGAIFPDPDSEVRSKK